MKADPVLANAPGKAPAIAVGASGAVRVVSLCCLYPNPLQPTQGLFIQRRLQCLAELTKVMVVAPVAVVQYGSQSGRRVRIGENRCAFRRPDAGMTVLHPAWFYPPFSGSLTACWLFLRLAPMLVRLRRDFPFEVI